MTAAPRPRILAFAVLAVALLCPVAAADVGKVTAEKASYRGGADQDGTVVAFFLLDGSDPNLQEDATLAIEINAGRLEALQIESHFLVGPAVGDIAQPVEDPRYDRDTPPTRTVLDKALATLVAQQADFQLHIVPADPAGAVGFTAHTDAGMFTQYDALAMDAGRFEEPGPLDVDDRVSDAPEFWAIRIDEQLIVHDDQASQFQAKFTGDFVLEIMGGTFEAKGQGEKATLESGAWTERAVAPGVPLPAGVDAQRRVLLRIFLDDATVTVGYQGATTDAYWASKSLASTHTGDATLDGATGTISSGDDAVLLEDDRYVLPAGTLLAMTPAASGIALDVQPAAQPATTAGDAQGQQGAAVLVGVAAVLALAAAVALGLARRSGSGDLHQIELAIQGQRYGRAARIAKRVLRARPGLEDAVLGRAIALSKAGRAGAAISEIHDHLTKRGASDGSLHYVLGLSFLDVGRMDDARVALGEAVARTPALQADVAARLGQAPSESSHMTLREVHGYA